MRNGFKLAMKQHMVKALAPSTLCKQGHDYETQQESRPCPTLSEPRTLPFTSPVPCCFPRLLRVPPDIQSR
jgi:hypothetical protein